MYMYITNIVLFEPQSLSPRSKSLVYLRQGISNYRILRGKPNVLANITFRSTACLQQKTIISPALNFIIIL